MHPNIAGALINSALYLVCVFVAGLVTTHPTAWRFALASMGITYLSHILSIIPSVPRFWCELLVSCSIVGGALAGLALLV